MRRMTELVDTTASRIAAEFVRARTRAGSPVMGMVMTLIVVVPEDEILVLLITGLFCRLFAPVSASRASLGSGPSMPKRFIPRPSLEKMELERMRVPKAPPKTATPSAPLKAMVSAIPRTVSPTVLLSPLMMNTPTVPLPRALLPSLLVPMRLPKTFLSGALKMSMPVEPLPEMRLWAVRGAPPMTLLFAPENEEEKISTPLS